MSDRPHIRTTNYCGEKVTYPDGDGCAIWLPWEDDEDTGLCFDFGADEIDELIGLLQQLKDCAPHREITQAMIDEDEREREERRKELDAAGPGPMCKCGHDEFSHLFPENCTGHCTCVQFSPVGGDA